MEQQVKRLMSVFIPYRIVDGELSVYMQKRTADAPNLPGFFGFFGGGMESGETPEQALVREVREELGIDLDLLTVEFFDRYELSRSISHFFLFAAPEGWENSVVIGEGDYGKWWTAEEAYALPNITFQHRSVINDLERRLLGKPIR